MWIFGWKGASGFSASSTAEQVTEGIDGTGLTAIVTGASSGLGAETARVLALRGVHVIMAGIAVDDSRKVKESILREAPNAAIGVMFLDLSSMASVRSFAAEYISKGLPLNILINNAGIFGKPFALSHDNIELHFATNYVGHFLLTELLLDTMKRSARESNREARIINVASHNHRLSYREGIRFDKINYESGYNSVLAYGQTKLANILHANELARRLKADGADVTANSVHPGVVITNIYQPNNFLTDFIVQITKYFFKNIAQGAATTCYVALNPHVKGASGEYFVDCNIATPSSQAKDAELARRLWDFSLGLIK